MKKLSAWIKTHKKEALIGGVALAALAYFLYKRGSGSSASTPGVGTLTYNTTQNPVITKTVTHIEKIPTPIASGWGHYNFLRGERTQLEAAMGHERGWLAAAKRAGNLKRVRQLTTRLKYQQGTLGSLNKQIPAAWKKAKK